AALGSNWPSRSPTPASAAATLPAARASIRLRILPFAMPVPRLRGSESAPYSSGAVTEWPMVLVSKPSLPQGPDGSTPSLSALISPRRRHEHRLVASHTQTAQWEVARQAAE